MGPFSNIILVLGFALLCSIEVIESGERNFLQRMNITKEMVQAKCTKANRFDDKSPCCNAKLPESCQNMLEEVNGQVCSNVVGSSICTDCCTDLFEAGMAASPEACCPAGLCGDTIGCKSMTGDCSCRPLDYFSGFVESCLGLGQPCQIAECCKPNRCIKGVCSKCAGKNTYCTDCSECCGTDRCVMNRCTSCGIAGMTCAHHSECCSGQSCYNGKCQKCVENGFPCSSSAQCCVVDGHEDEHWNYCDTRGVAGAVGVCQASMTMEQTSQNGGTATCTVSEQCAGSLECIGGSCAPCRAAGFSCAADSECCKDSCPSLVCTKDMNGDGYCTPLLQSSACSRIGQECEDDSNCCYVPDAYGHYKPICENNVCTVCIPDGDCSSRWNCCTKRCEEDEDKVFQCVEEPFES